MIVVRKDLNMRKGKMVAQGAHASLKAILDLMIPLPLEGELTLYLEEHPIVKDWMQGLYTKICVSVDSEQELLEVYQKAKDAGLICSLIRDAGLTEFNEPTLTCCAIGPAYDEDLKPITGNLKLL